VTMLVDVGNSRLKWCTNADGVLCDTGEAGHVHSDIGPVAKSEWSSRERPGRVLVANVAGTDAADALAGAAVDLWQIQPTFVRSARECHGIVSAYSRPEQLGVDRWVAMIGARKLAAGALGVVDCGTAITLDYVNARGRHRGGLIMPGVALMRRCLSTSTGDLPMVANESGELTATDTIGAISSGTLNAAAWSIQSFRRQIEATEGESVTWFLTGGGSSALIPLLDADFRHKPDLVLEGLAVFDTAACS